MEGPSGQKINSDKGAANEKPKAGNIVAECHSDYLDHKTEYQESDDTYFAEGMDALAQQCAKEADLKPGTKIFLILNDPIVSDIVFDSQNFFNDKLESALQKIGIKARAQGLCGGGPELIEKTVRDRGGDPEIHYPWLSLRSDSVGSFVLYEIVVE